MELNNELQNKRIKRAMKEINLELEKDAINFNKKIELAMTLFIAGFACCTVANIYTEIASPFMIASLCGGAITAGFYDPSNCKATKQGMYNIFRSCGALNRDANKDAVCDILDKYSKAYKDLIKNKSDLNKKELNLRKNELTNEYSKRIKSINNEERSEELFN